MKIAVIGSGGREHAIVWKLSQTLGEKNVFALPGNGGTPHQHQVDTNDFEALQAFCEKQGIGYIFVGPEAPLTEGIVDFFASTAIQVVGPSQQAAQLEGSKVFSKKFMKKYGVATADFEAFTEVAAAQSTIEARQGDGVIKYDGLAGGKGVWVCDTVAEAKAALEEMTQKYGENSSFLIEDKIIGDEISIIGFTDGNCIKLLLPSQDHKQLNDGDQGPNTGGMGVMCPVPFWNEDLAAAIDQEIVQPTLQGIQAEGMDYKGIIYFGIMIGEQGPQLLEYNVRFGDPETEVLLPALKTDLSEVIKACLEGRLADIEFEFHEGYFVDVVQVSGGYPKAYQKGYPIDGIEAVEAANNDILVFHAGTKKQDKQVLTNGGRVLNVVAHAPSLEEAIQKAYAACQKITFQDQYYRKDIGQRTYKIVGK